METSGMINTLAVALATATGALYPLFAPAIGAIGTFLTGSDTSANILFGKLQAGVAEHIGADPVWISASNTAGATGGLRPRLRGHNRYCRIHFRILKTDT